MDIDYEMANFLWVVLAALAVGVFYCVKWIVNVNKMQDKIEALKDDFTEEAASRDNEIGEIKQDVKSLSENVHKVGRSMDSSVNTLLQAMLNNRPSND